MKILITVFYSIILTYGINSAQSTMQVNIMDCRGDSIAELLTEFKIYRNDKLVKIIEPDFGGETINRLKYGNYKIEYESIFGKTEQVFIELSEKKTYQVVLCLNYLDHDLEEHSPIIDRIQNGESFSIQVFSSGCFHSYSNHIFFERKNDQYYVLYQGEKKLLHDNDIKAIRHFEIELNLFQNSAIGCTSTSRYVVKYQNNKVVITDGGCSWGGSYYLKRQLNLINKE